jgi:hypothetical protein
MILLPNSHDVDTESVVGRYLANRVSADFHDIKTTSNSATRNIDRRIAGGAGGPTQISRACARKTTHDFLSDPALSCPRIPRRHTSNLVRCNGRQHLAFFWACRTYESGVSATSDAVRRPVGNSLSPNGRSTHRDDRALRTTADAGTPRPGKYRQGTTPMTVSGEARVK